MLITVKKPLKHLVCSTANKGQSTVNYCQSSALDHPHLSCYDHCDWCFFQEIFFFINIILFPRNSFEQSRTCFIGI